MSPYAKTLIFWVAFVICGGSMYIFWDLCLNPELGEQIRGTWLLGSFLSCVISGGICVLMVIPEDVQYQEEFNTNEQQEKLK